MAWVLAVSAEVKVEWENVTPQQAGVEAVDFDTLPRGPFRSSELKSLFPGAEWCELFDRASIVQAGNNKRLHVQFPKGAVGPQQGGAQFPVKLVPSDECWLQYTVRFSDNFDFRLGGKLPGLTSGGATYTGGHRPSEGQGWSARYMFRKNGKAVIYLYWIDMPGKYGLDIPLDGLHFVPGKKYKMIQRIKLNSDSKNNGILQVWCNTKQLLDRRDIRFRLGDKGRIDTFYFSTFHGGQGPEWGPKVDCYAEFDDIIISRSPLK